MNRRPVRTVVAAAGLLTLAACVVNISFEMDKTFNVQSQQGAPTTIAQTQPVNLLEYKDVADHRDNIKSLDLDYAEAKVTSVGSANTATKVSGSIKLRKVLTDTSKDVAVGTLTNFPLTAGSTTRLNGSPALDQFLMDALKGDGKFFVVIAGTLDSGQADLVLDVQMHASVGYDAGIL